MNKNIKRIIALVMVFSAFSTIEPTKYINIAGTSAAYASSSFVSDLEVNKNDSSDALKLYKDEGYENSVEFKSSIDSYYVKTFSSSVNLTFDTESDYVTKVFKDDSKAASPFDSEEEISLSKGTNILYVRTYKKSKFDKNNVKNNVVEEHQIVVERKVNSKSDSIKLSNITLDYGEISFSNSQTLYDVDVNSSVDEIEITAKPAKKSYTVTIAGNEVTDDDDYADTVNLVKGQNEIEINITDDDGNENTYTLNIYRGGRSNVTEGSGEADDTQAKIYLSDLAINEGNITLAFDKKVTKYDVKVDSVINEVTILAKPENINDTVTVNGQAVDSAYKKIISLNDNAQNPIEVKVMNSSGEQRIYTLNIIEPATSESTTTATVNADSNLTDSTTVDSSISTTGTANTGSGLQSDNQNSGAVVKKWVQDEATSKWKYYDENGNLMKSNWFYYPSNNGWYYLDNDGYMKTGWLSKDYKWYYLNQAGIMQVGWINDGGNWYYCNGDGSMRTGWLQEGTKKYYLGSSGVMQTGTIDISGKSYKFDANGTLIDNTTSSNTSNNTSNNK